MPIDMSAPMSEEEMSAMEDIPMEEEVLEEEAVPGGELGDMTLADVAAKIAEGSMTIDEVIGFLQPEEMPTAPGAEELAMGGPEELM